MVAVVDIMIIGQDAFVVSSFVGRRGVDMEGDQIIIISMRVEYAIVRAVAVININVIRRLVGLNRIISRIISFE